MLIKGQSIRLADPYRRKYGDAIAEVLDLTGYPDDEVGTVGTIGNYRRWGKRVIKTDDYGFVDTIKFPSAADSQRYMSELRNVEAIIDVAESADTEIDHLVYDAALIRLEYVLSCALAGMLPHHSLRWSAVGRPTTMVGDERSRR